MGRLTRWWANLSLRGKGIVILAPPVLVLVVTLPLLYAFQQRAHDADADVLYSLQIQRAITATKLSFLDVQSSLRAYVVTGEPTSLDPYRNGLGRLRANLNSLSSLVRNEPAQLNRLGWVKSLATRELAKLDALRRLAAGGGGGSRAENTLLAEDQSTMDRIRHVLSNMAWAEGQTLDERARAASEAHRAVAWVAWGGLGLGLLMGLLGVLLYSRGVVRRARRNQENASRLDRQLPLLSPPSGRDEIGRAGVALSSAATLLSERQRAIRLAENLYRLMARNLPNGAVLLYDWELRFVVADGAGLTAVGLSGEVIEGRTLWDLFPPDLAEELEPAYRAALVGEETSTQFRYGRRRYELHVLPIPDQEGQIFAGMAIMQDTTDRLAMKGAGGAAPELGSALDEGDGRPTGGPVEEASLFKAFGEESSPAEPE